MGRRPKGELENLVRAALWDAGGWVSPQAVNDALDGSLAYSTVTTVLTRLVAKGEVERRRGGRGFVYRAATSREESAAARMSEILAAAGDRTVALSRFVEALDGDERARLREAIGEAPTPP